MIQITVEGRRASVSNKEILTSGSVGIECQWTFSEDWAGLTKTAVFRFGEDGDGKEIVLTSTNRCVVPWEVLTEEGEPVFAGVYGINDETGTIVVPTVWASIGVVKPGVEVGTPAIPAPTPSEIDQVKTIANDALNTAQQAMNYAEGEVDSARQYAESANLSMQGAASYYRMANDKAYQADRAAGNANGFALTAGNYAQTASQSASEASQSATNAASSASTATAKAGEANTSATTASQAAQSASSSATAAENSYISARDEASQAATSATTARGMALTAGNYMQAAAQSAAQAAGSATNASRAQTAAETAQGAAETAQGKAEDAQAAAEDAQAAAEASAQSVSASAAQIAQNTSDISDLTRHLSDTKSAIDELDRKYFYRELSYSGDSYHFETTDIYVNSGEPIILETKESAGCFCTTTGGATSLDISNAGTYEYTPDASGFIRFNCRNFNGYIYYPDFNIVSEEGTSKYKAASQYLAKQVANEVDELSENVDNLSNALGNKYDRYKVETVSGLALSDFSICPTEYTIVQYDNTDALQHSAITSSYIFSKLKYKDIKFRVNYGFADRVFFNLAVTDSKSIAFTINGTSGNVNLYTPTGRSYLPGVYRNENCRNIVQGDMVHFIQNGSQIAFYLVDNGVDKAIFADEFVDVISLYGESAGVSANDVGLGFTSSNNARGEPLIYDVSYINISGDHFMPYDEVDARLSALEDGSGFNPLKVDLFMFMGQSNMAGRGTGSQAPEVTAEAGYEFRAITDQTKLYPITEPFGLNENQIDGINDSYSGVNAKSGDMIPSFVNAYFEHTHVSIVGVSASEGGTRIALWQPDTARDTDALARYNAAINWLASNGYTIRHKYMLWCQGESNGDDGMSKADYKSAFAIFANAWFSRGIETIFLVKIGNYNGSGTQDYNTIMTAQNEICQETPNVVMVSTDFAGMKARGLMRDDFHYQQAAYNEVGNYAGVNTAIYVNTEKEPTMYDTQDGALYYSHKN